MPRVALVYPPTCDPTAPYLAVPMLTGFLRANGVEVLPIDANVEAWTSLLAPGPLGTLRDRMVARLAALDGQPRLAHAEQLEHGALASALAEAHAVPGAIDGAVRTLRDPERFFDPDAYASAVTTIDAALRVVSAAHHPLHVDFTAYRTPFGLTSMEEVELAAAADRDPFHAYVTETLVPRLVAAQPDVVGISVCFPGQLQPAYALALALRRAMPSVHLTCGGPGITQMMLRLTGTRLAHALGPFDSACLFEGEHTLLALVRALDEKTPLRALANVVVRDPLLGARWTSGHGMEDLRALPSPDFDGLPLDLYLSPALTLPYDPTRGCYWGKCTFCHYGLAEVGTASYRERDVATVVQHLRALSEKHGTKHFYLSQDSVAPKTIVKLAQAIVDAGLEVRWATDLKPEKYMTAERASLLRRAGAVACALGVESGSERVLEIIDKGAPPAVVGDVIDRLSAAGIAAEAMCFTDFPTESHDEALETFDFLAAHRERVALYIVGEFGLTHGSLVAQEPSRFGIREVWEVEGDRLGLGIFFEPEEPWKTDDERGEEAERLDALSSGWALRTYPWAGAVSTAHTVLYYDRFGPGVFRDLAARRLRERVPGARPMELDLHYDPLRTAGAGEREAEVWGQLVMDERRVGRAPYEALASEQPVMRPGRVRVRLEVGAPPTRAGRRPSHATSSARGR